MMKTNHGNITQPSNGKQHKSLSMTQALNTVRLLKSVTKGRNAITGQPVLCGDWRKIVSAVEKHPAECFKFTKVGIVNFPCCLPLSKTQAKHSAPVSLNFRNRNMEQTDIALDYHQHLARMHKLMAEREHDESEWPAR